MSEIVLLPCPCCGGKAAIRGSAPLAAWIVCTVCETTSGYSDTVQEAAGFWNRRAPLASLLAALRPFAARVEAAGGDVYPDTHPVHYGITLGDCRRAKRAVEEAEGGVG